MTKNDLKRKKGEAGRRKLEFVQDFLPIENIRNGIVETTDGRYIKILEVEPINFRPGHFVPRFAASQISWHSHPLHVGPLLHIGKSGKSAG